MAYSGIWYSTSMPSEERMGQEGAREMLSLVKVFNLERRIWNLHRRRH